MLTLTTILFVPILLAATSYSAPLPTSVDAHELTQNTALIHSIAAPKDGQSNIKYSDAFYKWLWTVSTVRQVKQLSEPVWSFGEDGDELSKRDDLIIVEGDGGRAPIPKLVGNREHRIVARP
ncbi:hypothetical protein BT63DRAFT_443518 [Microthyrium microscopicum]|uniref:Uncharacterized protein n=1 Tax=Microthyrium microscopicum TaxID=703497 RepID=A0A6A6TZ21_9PEZI|nr:hypothetical protein BT63DRAFT_443518 [Microthyrium microscopicum]